MRTNVQLCFIDEEKSFDIARHRYVHEDLGEPDLFGKRLNNPKYMPGANHLPVDRK